MEIDFDIKRVEVEKIVRELLEGDRGKKMKKKAVDWKNWLKRPQVHLVPHPLT